MALSVDGRAVCLATADVLGLWVCVLPVSKALADGMHVISATASVGNGNTSVEVSVLALGPSTGILTGPPRGRASTRPRSPSRPPRCSPDGAPTHCTPPHTVSGLVEGTHRMQVRSRDLLGLLSDTTPPVYTWTVDCAAPTVPLTSTPPAVSALPVGTFTFTASEPSTFTRPVDGGLALPCISPFVRLTLPDGTHTLTVTATDLAGNTATARHTWRVDAVLPDAPVITSPAVNVSVSLLDHVSGTAEPGATVRVLVDGHLEGTANADAQGIWSLPLPLRSAGPHLLTAVTVDVAGNVSLSATVALILDLTAAAAVHRQRAGAAGCHAVRASPPAGSGLHLSAHQHRHRSTGMAARRSKPAAPSDENPAYRSGRRAAATWCIRLSWLRDMRRSDRSTFRISGSWSRCPESPSQSAAPTLAAVASPSPTSADNRSARHRRNRVGTLGIIFPRSMRP